MSLQEDKIIIDVHAFNNRVFQIHEGSSQYTMIKNKNKNKRKLQKTSCKAKTKNEKRKRSKFPFGKEGVKQFSHIQHDSGQRIPGNQQEPVQINEGVCTVSGYKINTQASVVFALTSNQQSANESKTTIPIATSPKRITCLEVTSTKEAQDLCTDL